MPLRYPTDGYVVFLTLLALLFLLVTQLAHECEAQCTPIGLVDSLAMSASQPALQGSSLSIKLKVLGSSVTVTSVELFMTSAGFSPTGATLNYDLQGSPGPGIASSTRIVVSSGIYRYPFGGGGGVVLNPGNYWLVFTSSSSPITGWRWSDWSEDNFHSLSFASPATLSVVPTMMIYGCGAIPASTSPSPSNSPTRSATPSTTPTPSATPSSSPSTSPTRSATPSTTPTPYATPSSSPSPTSTPSSSPSASVSPSSSATPSAIPKLLSLTHATAEFDSSQAAFRLSGTFSTSTSSGSATSERSSVRSQVSSVQIGNVTLASDLNDTTREVIPATTGKPLTYVYTTLLLGAIEVHQSFAFHERETKASFAGVEFDIEANSVKWSLNFTSGNTSSSSSSSSLPHSTQPTIVRYLLAGDMLTAPAPDAADGRIIRRANTPREGLTTYYLPLEGSAVLATVLLFDMAVVDDIVSPVNHNITLIAIGGAGATSSATYKYEVEVELPAFDQWVHYDPSVGMGRLLGANGRGGDGGGSDNTGLIVGVAVAVPLAVVAVLAVIAAGVAFGWYKQRALQHSRNSINFDVHDGGDDQPDRL